MSAPATATLPHLYELMADFAEVEELMAAAQRARDAGYTKLDAYTPFPVEGLSKALGQAKSQVPLVVQRHRAERLPRAMVAQAAQTQTVRAGVQAVLVNSAAGRAEPADLRSASVGVPVKSATQAMEGTLASRRRAAPVGLARGRPASN